MTVAFPLVIVVGAEFFFRAIDYGPNLDLFLEEDITGKKYLIMNPDVKERYFSRVRFIPNTSNDFFIREKPQGTIRIFALGGSTTVGFPYGYVGSFPSFLRERLQKMFPEKNIEVINLGMTATNSFTVNDIAKELFEFKPDLLIVYDGHNEFYGALGMSSVETLGGSRWIVKTYLTIIHLRVFQFLKSLLRSFTATFTTLSTQVDRGTMMERLAAGQYVQYRNPEYIQCLGNFRENLRELAAMCVEHNVPLILGTQVSNVRDQKPFVSTFSPHVPKEHYALFSRLLASAENHFQSGDPRQANAASDSALGIDSQRADAQFTKARCLDAFGQKRKAKDYYLRARDLDQLRFRASADFNQAIREHSDEKTVFVADIEEEFVAVSRDSIVGKELILEHLHPRLFGNFHMAKVYVETMEQNLLLASKLDWKRAARTKEHDLWAQRSPSEVDERAAQRRIEILTSSWPFVSENRPIPGPPSSDTIGTIVADLVSAQIGWEEAHVKAAEFYATKRELNKALAEYRSILSQFPLSVSAHLRSAQLLLVQRDIAIAQRHLLISISVEKTYFALKHLGILAAEEKNFQQAILYLKEAGGLAENSQQRSESGYLLAYTHLQIGEANQATMILEQVLLADPRYSPARDLLTRIRPLRQ